MTYAKSEFGRYQKLMNRTSRAASRHPSDPMDAVWMASAKDITGAALRMMFATTSELVKTCGAATAMKQLTTPLNTPRIAADVSRSTLTRTALFVPRLGGRNVCAACDTPSPMTAKKK